MKPVFPTIGEYNQLFQKLGGSAFQTLNGIQLIPSRTLPIKVFLFGSGAYAAVFKGNYQGKTYAIRCFLTAEDGTIERYRAICNHIGKIQDDWITDSEFLKDEIQIGNQTFPILKMEWVEGLLINEFVDQNISDKNVLEELQRQLVDISNSLEKNNIGHGDLQCGNIIVTGSSSNFQIRLIDYDGMYVPELATQTSIELGRSEFQHPKRSKFDFNPEMDRFSFWVMLTALEAIKQDKTLWLEVMQGGFNTLDNFLFSIQDFINPENSKLFNRLFAINSTSLNYYLNELKSCCVKDISLVTKPILLKQTNNNGRIPDGHVKYTPVKIKKTPKKAPKEEPVRNDMFKIISNNGEVTVLTSTFQKLGTTPLELEKVAFKGKTLIVSDGNTVKQIQLNSEMNLIEVNLGEAINTKAKKETKVSKKKIESFNQEDALEEEDKENKAASKRRKNKEKKEREERESVIQEGLLIGLRQKEKEEKERLEQEKALIEIRKREKDKREKESAERIRNKQKEERKVIYIFLVVMAIFLAGVMVYIDNNKTSYENDVEIIGNTSPTSVITSSQPDNLVGVIHEFLKAEDSRDFERISSFISPNIRKYYNINNPFTSELKRSYEKAWSYTSNTKNSVFSIDKIDDITYDLITNYSYYDIRKKSSFKLKSKVRFVFDSNGKIVETYSLYSTPISYETTMSELNNKYDYVGSFKDSRALVKLNDKYGYIDDTGNEVIPLMYDIASEFSDGRAYVVKASESKYINTNGDFVAFVGSETKIEQKVNQSNWEYKYSYVGSLSEGLILVFANDKYGYVNTNGKLIIPLEYDFAEDFQNGRARVTYNGNPIYINKENRYVESVIVKPTSYSSNTTNNSSSSNNTTSNSYSNHSYSGTYKYVTSFNNPPWEISLRNENMEEIYKCPKNSKVYVIDNSGKIYFKVYVNGFKGLLTKHYLLRKS